MEPTPVDHEKRVAALMHLSSIPAPLWGPLIGLAVGCKSRYVRAHALQALYETLVLNLILGIAMLCSLIYTLTKLWQHYQSDWVNFSWTEFALRFVVGWILLGILWLINSIQAIRAALRANAGQWPKQARVVRRLTSLGIEARPESDLAHRPPLHERD
jgi:hypothetical protein